MPQPFWKRNTSTKMQKRLAKLAAQTGVDQKTLHILFNSQIDLDDEYSGWVEVDDTPPADIAYAVGVGAIPPEFDITPRALLKRLVRSRDQIQRADVASAFVSSLETQRPDCRSILGTYACFYGCDEVQLIAALESESGIAGLRNGRRKFTVRPHREISCLYWRANSMSHDCAVTALLEFDAFRSLSVPPPSSQAVGVLTAALDAVRQLPQTARLQDLIKAVKVIRGNREERQHVLEMLAFCDILRPREDFLGGYLRLDTCPLPDDGHRSDGQYPVCWWTGADGVNEDAVDFWFGHLI